MEKKERIWTEIKSEYGTILRDDTPLTGAEKVMYQFVSDRSKVEVEDSDNIRKSKYNGLFQKIWAKLFGISGKFLWGDTKQRCLFAKTIICKRMKCPGEPFVKNGRVCGNKKGVKCPYQ